MASGALFMYAGRERGGVQRATAARVGRNGIQAEEDGAPSGPDVDVESGAGPRNLSDFSDGPATIRGGPAGRRWTGKGATCPE
jgi:hypothetical protein